MTEDQLTRARRAMRAAVLRDQIRQRTNLTALIHQATGVAHNPAYAPRPLRIAIWSKRAWEAIHPKREQ